MKSVLRLKRHLCLVALFVFVATPAYADRVKLKNGVEFDALEAKKNGSYLSVQLPRAEVESVNGVALPAPVGVGTPAPAFTAKDLSGAAHTVPASGAPVLLQFWASWCPYCRKDMEVMKNFTATYSASGLKVISVSSDEDLEKLNTFLKEHAPTYPVIAEALLKKQGEDLSDRYETRGVPAYFVIDAKGMIVEASSGSLVEQPERREALTKAIEGVLVRVAQAR